VLEKADAAYDIAGYRDAPAGLRIWCGATVNVEDIEDLGPGWITPTKPSRPAKPPEFFAGRAQAVPRVFPPFT
jgi:hypothetical protein